MRAWLRWGYVNPAATSPGDAPRHRLGRAANWELRAGAACGGGMTDRALTLPSALALLVSLFCCAWTHADDPPPKRAPQEASLEALEARLRALRAARPRDLQALAALAEPAERLARQPAPAERAGRLRRDRARYLCGRVALTRAEGGEAEQGPLAEAWFRALCEGGPVMGREQEPVENEWLRHFAYLAWAESLALRDAEAALRLAEDLCGVDWWYSPEAALRAAPEGERDSLREAVARDRAHLQQVCREAHALRARLLSDAGRAEAALAVLGELERRPHGRGWTKRPGAIALIALRARARVELGQIERGVAELVGALQVRDPRVERGAQGEGLAEGCRALADLASLGPGVLRSPAASFYAGYGEQLRGRAGRSLLSYRRVLHQARTPEARARWVPRAAREAGAQLFKEERYLEAALAYEVVCREFPEDTFAEDAARYATAALRRARAQLGDPPGGTLAELGRRFEVSVGRLLPREASLRSRLMELSRLLRLGRWDQAAEGYAELAASEPDSRLRVRLLCEAGSSAWRSYTEPPQASRDPSALESCRVRLREGLQVAESRGWSAEEASARRRLAEVEAELGNLLLALELLEPFGTRLAETDEAFAARRLEARVLLKQGGPEAADAAERCFRAAGPGQGEERERFAYELVSRLRAWGEARANQTGRPLERRRARARAARYAAIYLAAQADAEGRLAELRPDIAAYLARVCSQGGLARPALESVEVALADAKLKTRPATHLRLLRIRALALAELELDRGIAALRTELRRAQLLAPGRAGEPVVLVSRSMSKETYPKRERGLLRQVRAWHFVIERGAQREVWVQLGDASPGDTRFRLIPGRDPNGQVRTEDRRVLELSQSDDLELLGALERALWERFRVSGERRLLTEPQGLGEVLARLLGQVRRASDAGYLARAAELPRATLDRSLRLWEVRVSCLRLELARQRWAKVESEIRAFELHGTLSSAPAEIRAEIDELRRLARAKLAR